MTCVWHDLHSLFESNKLLSSLQVSLDNKHNLHISNGTSLAVEYPCQKLHRDGELIVKLKMGWLPLDELAVYSEQLFE